MNSFKKYLVMSVLSFLGGCSLVPKSEVAALTVYRLPEIAATESTASGNVTQLLVAEPAAGLSLDGRRVMVLDARGQMQVLPDVIWADRPAAMLQAMLISAVAGSGEYSVVAAAGAGIQGDARLTSRLLDFQIEIAPAPRARVQLALSLATRGGRVACHTRIDVRRPVPGKDSAAMVAALRKVAMEAIQRSRAWLAGDACKTRPRA